MSTIAINPFSHVPDPPEHILDGAISWRPLTETDPENPSRWVARGFLVIYPDSLSEFDLDGLCYRTATLHAVTNAL